MSHFCYVRRQVIGTLLLGLVLGYVSGSVAQQAPAAPGGGPAGSTGVPAVPSVAPSTAPSAAPSVPSGLPGITAPPSSAPLVPGQSAPVSSQPVPLSGQPVPLSGQPALSPAPGTPGTVPVPQPGQGLQTPLPSAGAPGETAPLASTTTGTSLSSPAEPSPVERLFAGSTQDPHALLQQFGYDVFTRVPTTFAPVTDVPVGPDYVIGPGDTLNVLLWGGVQEAHQIEVDRNGALALPRLGLVQVWGLTLDQVQRLLQQRFSEFYSDFHMAVTLGKLRTILVYVVGEVRQPGAYTVSSLSTIINALFASGGPTRSGSLRRIQLLRDGRLLRTLDLYNFLLQGDKSQDQSLQSGDTIMVPLIGPVAGVAGNVKRPGIYEIGPGTTLRQLLDLAGDVTPLGFLQRVQVERTVANEKKIIVDVDLSRQQRTAATAALWQTRIANGDLVRLFAINTVLQNIVTLEGHVLRPGLYELKPGMRLRDILPAYTALLPETHLDYAEIVRRAQPDLRHIIVPFNLGALLAGESAHDLTLRPQDIIRIFPKTHFADPPTVTIEGEVRQPGTYPLLGEMRVKDLLARAGWLTPDTYLERAEILRLARPDDPIYRRDLLVFHLGDLLKGVSTQDLLLRPRDIVRIYAKAHFTDTLQVTIEGEVRHPATYELQFGMRIEDLIAKAGGVTRLAYLERAELLRVTATRDLQLILVDLGSVLRREIQDNLVLQHEDRLVIHSLHERKFHQNVQITGLVHKPGEYSLTETMRISDLIFRAGGTQKLAYLEKAELTRHRIGQGGETALRVEINLAQAMAGDATHNLLLEDFDQLTVRPIPDIELNRSVEILGEMRFPGTYPIQKGERLSSVLQRAGGFTTQAYPRGAMFTRVRARQEQEKRLQELIREQEITLLAQGAAGSQGALSPEELQAQRQSTEQQRLLLERLKSVQPEGRLVIQLQPLETFAGSNQDIELDSGDRIFIPESPKYINVLGEVYNHNALIYEPNRPIGYYLDKVGGLKPEAETDQVYLVQIDGTVISNTQNQFAIVLTSGKSMRFKDFFSVQPQPGDTIVVPRRTVSTAGLRNTRDIVQIIFQSVSSLGVIAALLTAL